jgi:hypothetical protein
MSLYTNCIGWCYQTPIHEDLNLLPEVQKSFYKPQLDSLIFSKYDHNKLVFREWRTLISKKCNSLVYIISTRGWYYPTWIHQDLNCLTGVPKKVALNHTLIH